MIITDAMIQQIIVLTMLIQTLINFKIKRESEIANYPFLTIDIPEIKNTSNPYSLIFTSIYMNSGNNHLENLEVENFLFDQDYKLREKKNPFNVGNYVGKKLQLQGTEIFNSFYKANENFEYLFIGYKISFSDVITKKKFKQKIVYKVIFKEGSIDPLACNIKERNKIKIKM